MRYHTDYLVRTLCLDWRGRGRAGASSRSQAEAAVRQGQQGEQGFLNRAAIKQAQAQWRCRESNEYGW